MPGIRLIFGSIALILGLYGLLIQTSSASRAIDRYDQPRRVQDLISRAYDDPNPEDQRDIARQFESELVASLNDPDYFSR